MHRKANACYDLSGLNRYVLLKTHKLVLEKTHQMVVPTEWAIRLYQKTVYSLGPSLWQHKISFFWEVFHSHSLSPPNLISLSSLLSIIYPFHSALTSLNVKCLSEGCNTAKLFMPFTYFFLKKWANPGLFLFIFVLFTLKFKCLNWKIQSLDVVLWIRTWGLQDVRRRRIHWAMAAVYLLCCCKGWSNRDVAFGVLAHWYLTILAGAFIVNVFSFLSKS